MDIQDFSHYEPKNPNGDLIGRCNNIRWNCGHPDCDYHYEDKETMQCPFCGTVREYCAGWPIKGREKCRFHGGRALMGVAHPQYQGRGVSKHLPTRLMEQYLLAYEDPDLLNFTDSISLMRTRRTDLIDRLDETPSHAHWEAVKKEWKTFRMYQGKAARGNQKAAQELVYSQQRLEKLIITGYLESNLWQEILDLEERMRKMKESEIRRREKIANLITPDQFKTLLGYIINSIKTRVKDTDQQMAVLADIQRIEWERKT